MISSRLASMAPIALLGSVLALGCILPVDEGGDARDQGGREDPLTQAPGLVNASTSNLFVTLNGVTASDVQSKIDRAWQVYKSQRLGSYQRWKFAGPGPAGGEVLSEGQSYAMMLAVQMNEQALFDQLYGFVLTCMELRDPGTGVYGYHAWKVSSDCRTISGDVAPDGEIWFAASLSLAARRWRSGAYDYAAEAQTLWTRLLHPRNDWGGECIVAAPAHPGYHLVRFGPYQDFTDPSYMTPGFFALAQGTLSGAVASEYADVYTRAHDFLQNTPSAPGDAQVNWGLHPNYATWKGEPFYPGYNEEYGPIFSYDAYRTVMNMAIDRGWTGNGQGYGWRVASRRQDQFYYHPGTVGAQVGLGISAQRGHPYGELIDRGMPVALVAMNATASALYDWADEERAEFTRRLWSTYHPSDYYGDNLYMLGLLVVGGQFKNRF